MVSDTAAELVLVIIKQREREHISLMINHNTVIHKNSIHNL